MRIAASALFVLLASTASAAPWQGITALAVAPDGRSFVTGGREGEVLVWEASTGEILGRWLVAALPVAGTAFSPDGALVAAVTLDGVCSAIRLSDGTVSAVAAKGIWKPLADAVPKALSRGAVLHGSAAAWKDLQARGTPDGQITVTLAGGAAVTWQAHEAAVTALAFLPGGDLLSASYDGSLGRWDPRTGRALGRL